MVLIALFFATFRRVSFFHIRFPYFRQVHFILCEIRLVGRLMEPHNFFHPIFDFYNFCYSYLTLSVFSGCDQSFFVLFYVAFHSLYYYIDAILNAGKPSFSFFSCLSTTSLGCKALCIV